jgi:PKD repeat protein
MLVSRPSLLAAAALACLAGPLHAASPVIDHSEIKCLVVGKYRKMPAKFAPADVAQPRVYFRPEGVPSWYYVEMKPEDPLGHVGVLPKPTKALLRKHIEYYVEAASRDFDTGRTPEYAPIVVEKDGECDRDLVPPLYAKNPPSAVFPSMPQGFAIGGAAAGIGTAAAVVGGGAAAAGAVVLATRGDDEPTPTSTSTTSTTSSTTSTTSTTTTTLAAGRFLSCQADVREGPVPLTVKFNAQAPGVFDYLWDFGDGGTSTQVNPSHTFTVPGVYQVTVRASNGALVDTCTRTVTALPAAFDLTVATSGSGTVSAPGIACPGDCAETYAAGSVVTLTATPVAGSAFLGWTGDCSGTAPTCALTMSQARSVTARFQATAPPTFPLTVTLAGAGTGSVSGTGIACGLDCTESYPAGSPVTLNAVATGGSSFAGFSGDCTGIVCTLTMDGPRNVTATFNPPAPTFTLTVTPAGLGTGTISGPGIACPGDCTETYAAGTPVALTAAPTGGSTFAGFSGDCTGTSCALTMNGPRNVTATFDPPATFPLNVTVSGAGVVTGTGISCPGDCTEVFPAGAPVALTAAPGPGTIFAWGGDCAGTTTNVCNLVMSAARNVTVNFTPAPFTLSVSVGGGGTGTLTAPGINCPGDCGEDYPPGTPVALTATPTGGATFAGWTGDCIGTSGLTCNLTMTANRVAGANFDPPALVPLTVLLAGAGAGTVSGQGCTAPCTQNFPPGTPVTLTAMPNMGSNFTGWSGDCTGIGTCSLVMNAAHTVTATFDPAALLTLTVTGPATAGTSVVAFPPAQTCNGAPAPGNTCTVPFAMGAGATLVPSTAGGLVANWGGDCAGTPQGANCMLIMSVNRTADATFVPAPLTEASRAGSTVMSRLEAAGARLSATLNEAPLPPPSPGPSTWAVAPRVGDNRLDAHVQAGAAGTWRLELAGVAGLEKGSLRVLSGEVVSVGPDAVVFRLKGRAGERFSLAFTVR